MKKIGGLVFLALLLFASCNETDRDLPSAEDRVNEATKALIDELTAPANGWKVEYEPTNATGTFLLFLKFDDKGNVNIRSDVPDEDGKYLDHTISYHIDYALGVELIFNTYGVFHYLFEKNQSTFGAEFEYYYRGKQGENLLFESKSDGGAATVMTMEPATTQDFALLSSELITQLGEGSFQSKNLAGVGILVQYQVYLENDNVSLFMTMDLDVRRIKAHGATLGNTRDEIINSTQSVSINQERPFSIRSGAIVFTDPIDFSLGGKSYSLSSLPLDNFQTLSQDFCGNTFSNISRFNSTLPDIGNLTVTSSLLASHSDFLDVENEVYQINYPFIYDENDSSLVDSVEDKFPGVFAFVWFHKATPIGFDEPVEAVGWATIENNKLELYLREITTVQVGNYIQLQLTDNTLITRETVTTQEDDLKALTDEIFSGGELYALEVLSIEGLFEIFNPCNQYKVFLF